MASNQSTATPTKIAFIGLGHMGRPMVRHLMAQADYQVRVFDVSEAAIEAFASSLLDDDAPPVEVAPSAEAAVQGADYVITMLPETAHVEALYLGEPDQDGGLLDVIAQEALNREIIVIDCSTIAPKGSIALYEAACDRGLSVLDAPVSGGTAGARAATLTFMIGGDEATYRAAEPVLGHMGKRLFHCGGAGAGQSVKICNNMLLAICMTGTAETLQLGASLGIDTKLLSEVMKVSSGNNWSLETYNPYPGVMDGVPASNNYAGGFSVGLMLKDLGLAVSAAEDRQQEVPLAEVVRFLYERLKSSSNASNTKDFSSIQELYLETQ